MRAAVCFAGHLRRFDNAIIYNSIQEKLLAPLREVADVDIFFSTWDKLNTQHCWSIHSDVNTELIDKPVDTAKVCELYNPVIIEIESFEKCYDFLSSKNYIGFDVDRPMPGYNGMLSLVPQAYKVYRANLLRLNHQTSLGITYDLIIRYRPDYFVQEKADFSRLEANTLYIPGAYVHSSQTIEDLFACGNDELMNIYCNLYLDLKRMFTLISDFSAVKFYYRYLGEKNIKLGDFNLYFQRYVGP
jgi:hypothetical protein